MIAICKEHWAKCVTRVRAIVCAKKAMKNLDVITASSAITTIRNASNVIVQRLEVLVCHAMLAANVLA